MNFSAFKEFRKETATISTVVSYLATELASVLRELRTGLSRLTFSENFESFEIDILIPAATEVGVRNQRTFIPARWIKLGTDEGGLAVCRGDAPWTVDLLSLKNTHATLDATVKIVFLR